jgi:DNA-binding transcriptional MerR regulator
MSGRWRIKEFALRTGVHESTLRAWERRYSLLEPERSAGGYRLYSAADERRVLAVRAHLARGLAVAEAAALARDEGAAALSVPATPAELVADLLDAIERFEATRVEGLLDGAFALGNAVAVRDVLMPTLSALGERWERGDLSVGQEHFASHIVERRLLRLASGWQDGSGPLALLACPSGERHTLGLLCFGLAVADHGWRIAFLGADTPLGEVANACDALGPDLVVLSAVHPGPFVEAGDGIREMGRRFETLLAGAGATRALARRLGVGLAAAEPVAAAAAAAGR